MGIVFGYAVKYNGKFYPPNTPIVEETVDNVEKTTEKQEPEKKPRKGKVKKDEVQSDEPSR